MTGAMRAMLEAGANELAPATVRKAKEQLVLLCQSYMTAVVAESI